MRKFFYTFFLALWAVTAVSAQNIKLYPSVLGAKVLDANNDTLLNAFTAGWLNPQISNIDLNGDGRQDLFVFQYGNGDNKIETFINIGSGKYQYAPEYESFFPPLQYWALLVDYNKDGKPDIFTYSASGGAIDVYKNISDAGGLKFTKVSGDYLTYHSSTGNVTNIFDPSSYIPAITDFDGDGDIDILALDIFQTYLILYKNRAADKGWSLDSLYYEDANKCWGGAQTGFSVDTPLTLNIGCGRQMKRMHGSTSLLAVDMDNDKDLDLLVGNTYDDEVMQYNNAFYYGGSRKATKDSLVSLAPVVVGAIKAGFVGMYPNAYYVDCDGDGMKDIIVTSYDAVTAKPNHKTYLYSNIGTGPGPHFEYVKNNFMQETMLDGANHASPAFFDYNNDGLMDMVIATRANTDTTYKYDHLELYKNIGSAKKPVYKKVDDDFGSLKRFQQPYLAPSFADINGDGRPDMFVGMASGKILYFQNMKDSGGSLSMKYLSGSFTNLKTGGYSTPALAHLSNDSLFDLVTGCDSGTFTWFQNTGTKTSPVFTKKTGNFGKVRTNYYYWQKTGPKDSTLKMQDIGRSAPVIADFDHDGKLDMCSGSFYGEMFFWFDIKDNLTGTFSRTDTVFYNTLTKKKENKFLGLFTVPAAADVDGDGYPDMLIGNNLGGVLYYGSQDIKWGIDQHVGAVPFDEAEFRIFPNPTHGALQVRMNETGMHRYDLKIFNLLGSEVSASRLAAGQQEGTIDISSLKSGVYFVQVNDESGRSGTRKIIVQ